MKVLLFCNKGFETMEFARLWMCSAGRGRSFTMLSTL